MVAAQVRSGPGPLFTSATARLIMTDERAQRLLGKELSHFSSAERNILVVRVSNVPGGMKWWWPLILRWFQPSRNRRVGAVILYDQAQIGDARLATRQRWRVIENPYAYRPVPRSLIDAIGDLDESAAWGEG